MYQFLVGTIRNRWGIQTGYWLAAMLFVLTLSANALESSDDLLVAAKDKTLLYVPEQPNASATLLTKQQAVVYAKQVFPGSVLKLTESVLDNGLEVYRIKMEHEGRVKVLFVDKKNGSVYQ